MIYSNADYLSLWIIKDFKLASTKDVNTKVSNYSVQVFHIRSVPASGKMCNPVTVSTDM